MAIPVATATVSGYHVTTIPYDKLPFTVPLSGAATNTPITEWEWVCVPSGISNKGSTPYGSFLPSGIVGTWTNGVNKNQNPTALLDEPGGYCFSLRARNGDGWSDPAYDGDSSSSQAITFVLTPEDIKLPAAQQYDYDRDLNETLNILSSGQISLFGKQLRDEQPTVSGQVIAFDGTKWGPQNNTPITYSLGQDYYLRDITASGISGYYFLAKDPPASSEVDDSAACIGGLAGTYGAKVLIESYATPEGEPGVNVIRPGIWDFHFYGYVNSATNDSRLVHEIYKRSVAGTETLLFIHNSSLIESTSLAAPSELLDEYYSSQEFILNLTDRLVSKVYAQTNSPVSKTVHYLHEGTSHASHFGTPIIGHTESSGLGNATQLQGYNIDSTAPTVSGQILTWNPAQSEYKPQVPFTNELLGKSITNHPTVSGEMLIWNGTLWRPERATISWKEQEFIAITGDQTFTLSAQPTINTGMLSGVHIAGAYRNGLKLRYQSSPTNGLEYGYIPPRTINCKNLTSGDIITIVYST